MKKFNPIKTYIPLYGFYYGAIHIEELFENRKHFIASSMVNAYTTIFAVGIIYNAVATIFI